MNQESDLDLLHYFGSVSLPIWSKHFFERLPSSLSLLVGLFLRVKLNQVVLLRLQPLVEELFPELSSQLDPFPHALNVKGVVKSLCECFARVFDKERFEDEVAQVVSRVFDDQRVFGSSSEGKRVSELVFLPLFNVLSKELNVVENVGTLPPQSSVDAGEQNSVQFSSDVEIFSYFHVDLHHFVSDQPPSDLVLSLQNPDENCNQFDFIVSVVLPSGQVFLLKCRLHLVEGLGFSLGHITLDLVHYHLFLVQVRHVLETTSLQSLSPVELHVVPLLEDKFFEVVHVLHLVVAPTVQLLDVALIASLFVLLLIVLSGVCLLYPILTLLIREQSSNPDGSSSLTEETQVQEIILAE